MFLLLTASMLVLSKNQNTRNDQQFQSKRLTKTATISINGKIEKVFPLFGAFEERKWADKWNPTLIYPSTEKIEEGTSFRTNGHGHNEARFLWVVTKYQLKDHLIQYLVSTENRYWTITVKCRRSSDSITEAEITYSFTSLNTTGDQINTHSLQTMYSQNLKDWEKAINYYLQTGKTLQE